MEDADNSLELEELVIILLIYVALGLPLAFFGSFCGYKSKQINIPFKVNKLSKEIPP